LFLFIPYYPNANSKKKEMYVSLASLQNLAVWRILQLQTDDLSGHKGKSGGKQDSLF
jgi:hypothetical protein